MMPTPKIAAMQKTANRAIHRLRHYLLFGWQCIQKTFQVHRAHYPINWHQLGNWRWIFFLWLIWAVCFGAQWVLTAHTFDKRIPPIFYGLVEVTGVVSGLPVHNAQRGIGYITVVQANLAKGVASVCDRNYTVRLSYFGEYPLEIEAGSTVRFFAKLRRNNGQASPNSRNYEDWLFQNHIDAVGYIRNDYWLETVRPAPWYSISAFRQKIKQYIDTHLPAGDARGLFKALTLGDKSEISQHQWYAINATGTTHLLAISGLHIGLIAALVGWFSSLLWRQMPILCIRCPAPVLGLGVACVAALLYTAMAGFSIPTQRAFIMVLIYAIYFMMLRHAPRWWLLLLAFICVSLWDIRAVISPGFVLSFLAVAILICCVFDAKGWLNKSIALIKVQWALNIIMLPAVLFFFGYSSAIAPVVNFVLVPIMSVIILPLCMIGVVVIAVLPTIAGFGHDLLHLFATVLHWCAQHSWALLHVPSPPWYIAVIAVLAFFFAVLSQAAIRFRVSAALLGTALLLPIPSPVEYGQARVMVLDVGQGLSVIVATQNHALVYDAGLPGMGRRVVAPALRSLGTHPSRLIISHQDNDHSGGMQWLRAHYVNTPLIEQPRCTGKWQWDGVEFIFLATGSFTGNNGSCVLLVKTPSDSLLLSGDIESMAEQHLLGQYPHVQADWLIAPHHGSNTSSSAPFLQHIKPHTALVSAGFQSRYGHPHQRVMQRYQQQGIRVLNTACSGSILFTLGNISDNSNVIQWRRQNAPFWWRQCERAS